jgi:hypothetical protein
MTDGIDGMTRDAAGLVLGDTWRDAAGREEVDCDECAGPGCAVMLAFGQSNIANEGDPEARYAARQAVFNFDFLSGRCYRARDPLLGATWDRSNVLTRLGDLLIERGRFARILLVPIAFGGSFVAEWSPGGRHFPRLALAVDRLARAGLAVSHALWHQGEAEAAEGAPELVAAYGRHFRAIVGALRQRGVAAPIYVSQATVCRNRPNEALRAVQRSLVDPAAGLRPGPDTDGIGLDERWDGCHFGKSGLERAARLWYEALTAP